ncbi:hypothetical protein NC652_030342 [Populus alba x Populus x berolinensis]|nr:hypothetical protein NC652_030342 [Populus alba x Populus x berolinensis]
MTEVYRRMLNDDGDDSPEKCRERRRRRIEMRRLASGGSSQPIDPLTSKEKKQAAAGESSSSTSTEGKRVVETVCEIPVAEPVFGSMSVSGRSREMEDAISVRINLFQPEVNRRRPVHLFGVFDGHGGAHVAALCRERMHVLIEEELARVDSTRVSSVSGGGEAEWEEMWRGVMKRSYERMDEVAMGTCACGSEWFKCGCHPMQMALGGSTAVVAVLSPEHIIVANCGDSRAVLSRGGRAIPLSVDHKPDRSDELARIEAAGGRVIFLNGARVEGILAMSRAIAYAIQIRIACQPEVQHKHFAVFKEVNKEQLGICRSLGNSVAMHDATAYFIIIQYEAINVVLTVRICCYCDKHQSFNDYQSWVLQPNYETPNMKMGCVLVFIRNLAVSVSIRSNHGAAKLRDKYLKPVVIAEPEITFTKREPEDECLILASDGLWDVLSSDLACQVARECLREKNPPAKAGPQIEEEGAGALYPSRSMLAAALLTRLALGRRSADNISVIKATG